MTLDDIIARCEADASTQERKMILALAKHVHGDKPAQDKKGGQKKQDDDGASGEAGQG